MAKIRHHFSPISPSNSSFFNSNSRRVQNSPSIAMDLRHGGVAGRQVHRRFKVAPVRERIRPHCLKKKGADGLDTSQER